jgi:hypothetical protein
VGATAQISEAFLLHDGTASFHKWWISFGQGKRIPQPQGRRAAGEAADRADEITAAAVQPKMRVEAKNGAVIRKHMGYGHIASDHPEAINTFYEKLKSVPEFHRPSGRAELVDSGGQAPTRLSLVCDCVGSVAAAAPVGCGIGGPHSPDATVECFHHSCAHPARNETSPKRRSDRPSL